MNGQLATLLIAVSLTALGLAFFLWARAAGGPFDDRIGSRAAGGAGTEPAGSGTEESEERRDG